MTTRARWSPERPYDGLPGLKPIGELLTARVRAAEKQAATALRAAREAIATTAAQRIVREAGPTMEGWASSLIEQVYADPGQMVLEAGGGTVGDQDVASATGCAHATKEAWEPGGTRPRWPSTEAAARAASLAKLSELRVREGGVGIYRGAEVVYTPPRGGSGLHVHLGRLWEWIERWAPEAPLVATAAAHYQFEAIHPFADGNGRAGRVLISAMLRTHAGAERYACAPSVAIRQRLGAYYEALTAVTAEAAWERWILYMLDRIAVGADYVRSNVEIAAARGRRSAAAAGGDAEYAAIVEMATAQAHVTSRDVGRRGTGGDDEKGAQGAASGGCGGAAQGGRPAERGVVRPPRRTGRLGHERRRPLSAAVRPMPLNLVRRLPPRFGGRAIDPEAFLRLARRWRRQHGLVGFWTRRRPRRETELHGGSVHFVIGRDTMFRLPFVRIERARSFAPDIDPAWREAWAIVCRPEPVMVESRTVHRLQGWRYLEAGDAPADVGPARPPGESGKTMGNETLTQWMPERAGRRWRSDENAVRRATPAVREGTENGAGDVILVTLAEPVARCDRMALHRAAGLNGLDDRLCEPNRKLEGQAWYDRLARLVDVEIAVTEGDATATLEPDRLADGGANERVDRIVVVGTLEQEGSERRIELTTDLAVRSDLVKMPTAAGVMLAKDSTITLETLQELLHQGLFYVDRDDEEDDGPETQEEDFEQDAHYAACRLLLPSDDAACEIVRYAVEHRIAHLLPKDRAVVIRRPAGATRVEVSFD